ncbi:hypothetical protein GCM10023185_15510 [Hymenobacter saemangeumensis]|uniref:Uncharacterized protein n=1 Tax=Hymenobacter saemangeumensis TaxID=1084522 RepID=A0ABP8I9Y3_9BACT
MKPRFDFRTLANTRTAKAVAQVVLIVGMFWAVVASSGCATTRPSTSTETVITDSTTLRQVQRLVAVSVPGDSAKLTTRLAYDERTGRIRPVTIYSNSGHTTLAFSVDAYGLVKVTSITKPFVAQVPVVDTEISRTRQASTTTKTEAVVTQNSRFARYCIGFTVVVLLCAGLWFYIRFFTPFRFIK